MTDQDALAGRWYFLAWELARRLPEPLAFALGRAAGRVYFRREPGRRAALRANLRQVLGPTVDARTLEVTVRRGIASYARYWVEAFRLEDSTPDQLRRSLRLAGREHLDAAVAAGRGVIFATPHLGNWDAGGAWLGASGYPTTVVVERLRPTELYERFAAYRRSIGLEILPLDDGAEALRGVLRVLRAGQLAALVCDRDLTGRGVPVRMFGAATTMPAGPASLALRTGAALLPVAVYQARRRGRWEAVIRPPVRVEPSGNARTDTAAVTQALATEFEGLISRRPEQWHVLSPLWRGPGRAATAARVPAGERADQEGSDGAPADPAGKRHDRLADPAQAAPAGQPAPQGEPDGAPPDPASRRGRVAGAAP